MSFSRNWDLTFFISWLWWKAKKMFFVTSAGCGTHICSTPSHRTYMAVTLILWLSVTTRTMSKPISDVFCIAWCVTSANCSPVHPFVKKYLIGIFYRPWRPHSKKHRTEFSRHPFWAFQQGAAAQRPCWGRQWMCPVVCDTAASGVLSSHLW